MAKIPVAKSAGFEFCNNQITILPESKRLEKSLC